MDDELNLQQNPRLAEIVKELNEMSQTVLSRIDEELNFDNDVDTQSEKAFKELFPNTHVKLSTLIKYDQNYNTLKIFLEDE